MSIKLFIMTHKPFIPPEDPMYVPLHVGRANTADLGFWGDDTKDSISALNPYFCELKLPKSRLHRNLSLQKVSSQ